MNNGYIYLTICLIDGMLYIGKHKSETFDTSYKGSGTDLNKHFKLYGKDNFICIPLIWCKIEELSHLEEYILKSINVRDDPLFLNKTNKTSGVHTHSKETKEKISKKSSALWHDKEFVKRSIESRKKSWAKDEKRKLNQSKVMSLTMKEQWSNPEIRAKRIQNIKRNLPKIKYSKEIINLCRSARLNALMIFTSPSGEKFLGSQRQADTYFKIHRRIIREGIKKQIWFQSQISINQLLPLIQENPNLSRKEIEFIFLQTLPNTEY